MATGVTGVLAPSNISTFNPLNFSRNVTPRTTAGLLTTALTQMINATYMDPPPSTVPDPPVPPAAEQNERFSSLALFLVLMLLIGSFWTSYYLKVKKITAVHETIVGLFAGMFVGLILRIGPGEQVQKMLRFSNTIMLNVLLPPIILASGYDLRQENFFRNFWVILCFAFAGTFISAIVIGAIVYIWSLLQLESLSLSFLECLIFGSTLSATDPVTILAIFNTYKVDPQLYSVIFGESILNDAVSIVMFDTLSTFRGKTISALSIFHGFGLFIVIFTLSMALGICFGLGCSLMLKHSRLSYYPALESCLVFLIAYTSYFFSNSVTMSGIVSLLFCGITLKHYAYHNMSTRTQKTTKYIFQTLANLSENFIFIYLGLSLFTQDELVYKPLFIIITVVAVVVSRYCAVFPIAGIVNAIRRARNRRRTGAAARTPGKEELPREYQIMLFWAGLRGAVGFALSAGIEGTNAIPLQTTVLVAVVLTVIMFGGTTAQMLEILGIRTGVQDDGDSSDEDEYGGSDTHSMRSVVGSAGTQRRRAPYRRAQMSRTTSGVRRSQWEDRESARPLRASFKDNVSTDDIHTGHGGSQIASPLSYGWQASGRVLATAPADMTDFSHYELDDDEDMSSSHSGEVLPAHFGASPTAEGTAAAAPTVASRASSSAIGPLDLEEARSGIGSASARQLLGRAGLIMRDGQWFQRIDERYLLPMFSNSVANRKAEERKKDRLEAQAAAVALSKSAARSTSAARNELVFGERDADVVEDDEDDEAEPTRPLVGTASGPSTLKGAFGP
ncbi:sodium/hydrogen exchanger [Tilletiaria anomala UBC 951]|uniref:Sodium/hydrogen exchanger n=1 Tax=Tilletiaria anomala (strain ATCC 24038 / CBS 436.72 / UBC 951) TaxID=1037660 RepID=A0A066VW81_TILAU|nr:sodium/hydrogen exchanger [Tilletiaria anomala UBC 951]KDN45736.1 sodium/hydrogen exchanger [Tilletiaria anomala UBC 951]